jgi:hypothetical protein
MLKTLPGSELNYMHASITSLTLCMWIMFPFIERQFWKYMVDFFMSAKRSPNIRCSEWVTRFVQESKGQMVSCSAHNLDRRRCRRPLLTTNKMDAPVVGNYLRSPLSDFDLALATIMANLHVWLLHQFRHHCSSMYNVNQTLVGYDIFFFFRQHAGSRRVPEELTVEFMFRITYPWCSEICLATHPAGRSIDNMASCMVTGQGGLISLLVCYTCMYSVRALSSRLQVAFFFRG